MVPLELDISVLLLLGLVRSVFKLPAYVPAPAPVAFATVPTTPTESMFGQKLYAPDVAVILTLPSSPEYPVEPSLWYVTYIKLVAPARSAVKDKPAKITLVLYEELLVNKFVNVLLGVPDKLTEP
jgi:hypothetical protein